MVKSLFPCFKWHEFEYSNNSQGHDQSCSMVCRFCNRFFLHYGLLCFLVNCPVFIHFHGSPHRICFFCIFHALFGFLIAAVVSRPIAMAVTPHAKKIFQNSANTTNPKDQENGLSSPSQPLHTMPRWPRNLGVALNILVILLSIAIISLVSHSLHSYSSTRNIKFSGINASWPKDLNLRPAYFFLAISSLTIAFSFVSSIHTFLRRNSNSLSVFEAVSLVATVPLFGLWIAGDVIQYQSERVPKGDVLEWSCRRRNSPTNTLVSYASICDEQVS